VIGSATNAKLTNKPRKTLAGSLSASAAKDRRCSGTETISASLTRTTRRSSASRSRSQRPNGQAFPRPYGDKPRSPHHDIRAARVVIDGPASVSGRIYPRSAALVRRAARTDPSGSRPWRSQIWYARALISWSVGSGIGITFKSCIFQSLSIAPLPPSRFGDPPDFAEARRLARGWLRLVARRVIAPVQISAK
jgi:hypothetical protein